VKNASAFRTKFEASLPDVMESFNELYRSITGRITAEALKVTYIAPFVEYSKV
jgi:U2-associated protein SR140